jgi:hypothetical protein
VDDCRNFGAIPAPLNNDDRRVDQANFTGIWTRLMLAPVAAAAKLDRKVLAANVRHVRPADHQHALGMKYHGKIADSTPCFCHMAIDIFR